ncbi:MAG: hypothetical protein LBU37_12420 [Tannerellaceae bacterium]|jgi:hypothetical protein|nr:hypothetical protein [Tannerellaceae bacterium]
MKKNNIIYSLLILISALFLFNCCSDNDEVVSSPVINIPDDKKEVKGANEGDLISVPFSVSTENGIRRIAYYFIVNTANETKNEEPVIIENYTEDFPKMYEGSIDFSIRTEMSTLILVVFNKENQASEVHISLSELKELPVFRFDKDLDYKEKAFLGKNLKVKGNVTSEYDINSFTYRVTNNGVASAPVDIPVIDRQNVDFDISIIVEVGLENILFDVTNVHEGKVERRFQILNVLTDDDISIEIAGGITELTSYMEDEENIIEGTVESGSNIIGLAYSVKKNGVFGSPVEIDIPEDVIDLYNFTITVVGEAGTEAVKIIATNESELVEEIIIDVPYVDSRIVYIADVVLTTEIGEGKYNWFSCYQAPHRFDQITAAQYPEMMDFVAAKYTTGVPYLLSAMVYTAGGNYATAVSPYMVGFDKMTYLLVTANRPDAKNAFDAIEKTSDMEALFKSQSYYATAGRYTSGALTAGNYHVIGWGNGSQQNKAIGIIKLKEINTVDGISTVKFDIKFGKPDYRTMYNGASMMPYNP